MSGCGNESRFSSVHRRCEGPPCRRIFSPPGEIPILFSDSYLIVSNSLSLYLTHLTQFDACAGVFDVCWCMLMHVDAYWRMLTHVDACWRMLTHADACWRMLTPQRIVFIAERHPTTSQKRIATHLRVHQLHKKYCIFHANNLPITKFTRSTSHTSKIL